MKSHENDKHTQKLQDKNHHVLTAETSEMHRMDESIECLIFHSFMLQF